jgi:hypothetical protein
MTQIVQNRSDEELLFVSYNSVADAEAGKAELLDRATRDARHPLYIKGLRSLEPMPVPTNHPTLRIYNLEIPRGKN